MRRASENARVLAERVVRLTESRDASVEGSAHELRRIERELGDDYSGLICGIYLNVGLGALR